MFDSLALGLVAMASRLQGEPAFQDDFKGKLGEGWTWVREHREGWRVLGGLEVRIEPGNMWGPPTTPGMSSSARRRTRRRMKSKSRSTWRIVQPSNTSKLISLGITTTPHGEAGAGVGGRQTQHRHGPRGRQDSTIAIIPLSSFSVQLRFLVRGEQIHGQFRTPGIKGLAGGRR